GASSSSGRRAEGFLDCSTRGGYPEEVMNDGVPADRHEEPSSAEQVAIEPVILSPTAIGRVKVLLQREGRPAEAGLRVSVVGGGCSGLQYSLGLEDRPNEDDTIYEYDGVRVFVDPTSAPYLSGTKVDYV